MYYLLFSFLPFLFSFFPLRGLPHLPMLHAKYMLDGPQAAQWTHTEDWLNAMRDAAVVCAVFSLLVSVLERMLPARFTKTLEWCNGRHREAADIACTQILMVCVISWYRSNVLLHF